MYRCASVLLGVAVMAAACSSPPPSGSVGSTLSAMGGTVTLDKVISPANVTYGWPYGPAAGHVLVAVVLTVHSPATASAPFERMYSQSRLVDSTGKSHPAKATNRYRITDCVSYPAFASLGAGQSSSSRAWFPVRRHWRPR
ncbi:MAG: hypothetical protein ABSG81_17020 [Acidimicrobiales bacterium]